MDEYGLIGRNISHSFSADYFNRKFTEENIDARYFLFDLQSIVELENLLRTHPDIRGLNVTSPYKREVIPFLDSLSDDAERLNAVNVIQFKHEEGKVKLIGHNTDHEGFRMTLPYSEEEKYGLKALVLGSGGASTAVCHALERENISYKVVSRCPKENQLSYAQAREIMADCKFIINATPIGMGEYKQSYPPLDYDKLTADHLCYDLIYNPSKTLFLRKAESADAKIKNGLEMLINQANLAWKIWNK